MTKKIIPKDLITTEEVSKKYHISVRTLKYYRAKTVAANSNNVDFYDDNVKWTGPRYLKLGYHVVRYSEKDVIEWIAEALVNASMQEDYRAVKSNVHLYTGMDVIMSVVEGKK
jgi:predicted DNA-binding transcriptional regulator AlpA